tara:strand:+ start:71 stop:355 length:285 start_codon:yes stop_codon:yes gene_type:complete
MTKSPIINKYLRSLFRSAEKNNEKLALLLAKEEAVSIAAILTDSKYETSFLIHIIERKLRIIDEVVDYTQPQIPRLVTTAQDLLSEKWITKQQP